MPKWITVAANVEPISDQVAHWFDAKNDDGVHDLDFTNVSGSPTSGPNGTQYAYNYTSIGHGAKHADDSNLDLGTSDFSLAVWVKTPTYISADRSHTLMHKFANNTTNNPVGTGIGYLFWYQYIWLSPRWRVFTFLNPGDSWLWNIIPPPAGNTWQHLAVTIDRSSGAGKLYVNGTYHSTSSQSDTSGDNVNNGGYAYIGGSENIAQYGGYQSDIYLFKNVLSAAEVFQIYKRLA